MQWMQSRCLRDWLNHAVVRIYFAAVVTVLLHALTIQTAAAAPVTELQVETARITVSDFEYFADPSGDLTLESVLRDPSGFTSASQVDVPPLSDAQVYWLRYQLKNTSEQRGRWHIGYEWFVRIDFYQLDEEEQVSSHIVTGQMHPFYDRPVKPWSAAETPVPIVLEPEETTQVIVRLEASTNYHSYPKKLAASVFTEAESREQRGVLVRVVYLCAGLLLGTLVYNLFVYLSTGDHSYRYYLGIVACSLVLTFANFLELPIVDQYDQTTQWVAISRAAGSLIYGFFIIMFTRSFLNVRENFPWLDRILIGIIICLLVLPVLIFSGQMLIARNLSSLFGLITMVVVLITAICSVWKRQPSAGYFLFAFAFFAIGICVFLLTQLGVLPRNNLTNYAMQYGTSLEAVLFSFALGNRINLLRRENESSQQQLITQMTENEKLQKEWTKSLEEKVEEQTRSLSRTNAELSEQNSALYSVNNLSRELSAQLTRPKIVELVGQRLQTLYPESQVRMYLADNPQTPMLTAFASNDSNASNALNELVAEVRQTGAVAKREQKPVDDNSAATLAVPIRRGDVISGALVLQSPSQNGFTESSENLIGALGANIGTALSNASLFEETTALNRKLQAENLRISAELSVAAKIQQIILPTAEEISRISQLQLAAFMLPADEVGGDYYDILQVGDRVTVAIGDVTGHGLASGVLMMQTQIALRTLLENSEFDDIRLLGKLNQSLYRNLQRMREDRNLSLSVVTHQDAQVSISGQHEDILLVDKSGSSSLIDTIDLGFPVGLEEDIANHLDTVNLSLGVGDGIVLYTDGITEAEDSGGSQYGMDRLRAVVEQQWHNSVQEIVDAVIDDVRSHIRSGPVVDDITLVILKQP